MVVNCTKNCRFGAVELWGLREILPGGWLDIYYRWLMLDMDIGKIENAMYGMYSHSSSYNNGSWKWVPRRLGFLYNCHFHFHIYGRVLVGFRNRIRSHWGYRFSCLSHMKMSLLKVRRYHSRHGQAFKRLRQQGTDIPRETSIPSDRGTELKVFRTGQAWIGTVEPCCEYIFEYLQTSVLKMLELRWNWQKHFKETAQYMIMSHFSI